MWNIDTSKMSYRHWMNGSRFEVVQFFFGICFSEKHNKTFHLFLLLFEKEIHFDWTDNHLQPFYGLRLFWPNISHLHQSSALSQYLFFIQHPKNCWCELNKWRQKSTNISFDEMRIVLETFELQLIFVSRTNEIYVLPLCYRLIVFEMCVCFFSAFE